MRRISKRARRILALAALGTAVTAAALGYWTGPGAGTSQLRLDDPKPLTLGVGTPSAELYPGGSTSVAVVAGNPNPYGVHIAALKLDTAEGTNGFEVDPPDAGCNLASIVFTAQDNHGSGWTVPPKAGTTDGSLKIDMSQALTMDASAANACQGAVFTVHLMTEPHALA